MNSKNVILTFIIIIAVMIGLQTVITKKALSKPSPLDPVAQCINTSGAKFYGHYQCPHCHDQKKIFGNAQKYLPYVECGVIGKAMGLAQTKACEDAKIEAYPTWKFSDGTEKVGEASITELALKTKCTLPTGFVEPVQ